MGKEKLKEITCKAKGDEEITQANNANKIDKRAQSSSSIKSKRSSNILAALVRRTKRNKSKNSENEGKLIGGSNTFLNLVASTSTLGIHTEEEVVINTENYDQLDNPADVRTVPSSNKHETCNFTTDSDYSISVNPQTKHIFRKSNKKQNSVEKSETNTDTTTKTTCKVCKSETKDLSNSASEQDSHVAICFPTCYVNFKKRGLSSALSDGLQMIQDLTARLYESENQFIQIFTKYVKDPTFKNELMDTLSCHSKLQWETERRTTSLVNEIWTQQLECGRAQEKALQETLNSLVKQNRKIQVDNEFLFRKHEKLIRKLRTFGDIHTKLKSIDFDVQIDHVFRHNEKLQHKLEEVYRDLDSLESELHLLQRHNGTLEVQLRNSSSTIYHLKTLLNRTKTDYDLEIISVSHELQRNEKIIRDATEAGDVLLEDFESLKRQAEHCGLHMDWSKFKCRGSSLSELVHFSRCYINELSKEICSLTTQIALKDKDIEGLQQLNTKLQENLQKSSSELHSLTKKLEEDSSKETEKLRFEQRCHSLELDLKTLEAQMEQLKIKHETEKTSLMETISEYEQHNLEIAEKDRIIDQSKLFICNIASENMSLRCQIDHLNRLLCDSGAGDVLRELTRSQENLSYYQSQYDKLMKEKEMLLEQQKEFKADKKAAQEHQEANLKQLYDRLKDLENIQKENVHLRQQVEGEHQTVMSLQNERMKHLEEKDLLKTLFQRMKSELSRVQQLEEVITEITKEASKLALIAEYNKQLGSKLKSEVAEKDKTITILKNNVEQLNDIQLKDTKEKMSLCYELSEVCQVKNQLSQILSVEMEKMSQLDTSKKELIQNAKTKLKKFEEVQQNDRTILKDVVRDLKIVVKQKDDLQKEKDSLQEEVKKVKSELDHQINKYDDLLFVKNELEINYKEVSSRYSETEKIIKTLQEQISSENLKYNEGVGQLKKLIVLLRKEKEDLDSTIKYLQNNTQRLHNDLNESRKNEKEIQNELKKRLKENAELEKEKEIITVKVETLNLDKSKMSEELLTLNNMCEKVLETLEVNTRTSMEKEALFKKELEELRRSLLNSGNDYESLKEKLRAKETEIEKLNQDYKQKEQQIAKLEQTIEGKDAELAEAKKKIKYLEHDYEEINSEYRNIKYHNDGIYQECSVLHDKLNMVIEQKENDALLYKSQLGDALNAKKIIEENCKSKIRDLRQQLSDLAAKLDTEKSSYLSLSQVNKEFKEKFAKYVEEAADDKRAREQAATQLKNAEHHLETLKVEKMDLQQQINILLDGLNESKNRINALAQEKENLQKGHEALQKRYNESLKKCICLENKLRESELKEGKPFSATEVEMLKEKIKDLKFESTESHYVIVTLKEDIASLEQRLTECELQKSELTLRLHEMQRKHETEYHLCEKLKNTQKQILSSILQMRQDGKIDSYDSNNLVHIVQNSGDESEL